MSTFFYLQNYEHFERAARRRFLLLYGQPRRGMSGNEGGVGVRDVRRVLRDDAGGEKTNPASAPNFSTSHSDHVRHHPGKSPGNLHSSDRMWICFYSFWFSESTCQILGQKRVKMAKKGPRKVDFFYLLREYASVNKGAWQSLLRNSFRLLESPVLPDFHLNHQFHLNPGDCHLVLPETTSNSLKPPHCISRHCGWVFLPKLFNGVVDSIRPKIWMCLNFRPTACHHLHAHSVPPDDRQKRVRRIIIICSNYKRAS